MLRMLGRMFMWRAAGRLFGGRATRNARRVGRIARMVRRMR